MKYFHHHSCHAELVLPSCPEIKQNHAHKQSAITVVILNTVTMLFRVYKTTLTTTVGITANYMYQLLGGKCAKFTRDTLSDESIR